jgi:hypothetical protein
MPVETSFHRLAPDVFLHPSGQGEKSWNERHKRLVAWRWLALRFPDNYPDREEAEDTTMRLNEWIENVLRQQSRTRKRSDGSGHR